MTTFRQRAGRWARLTVPLLVAGATLPASAVGQPVVPLCEPIAHVATPELSDLARFNLGSPSGAEACGLAELVGAWSPFGLAVTRDGHLVQELRLTVHGLEPAGPDEAYVAWLATPALDRIERLGEVQNDALFTAEVDWNKMLVVVSHEAADAPLDAPRWQGRLVLLGRARAALLQNVMGHSIFQRAEFED